MKKRFIRRSPLILLALLSVIFILLVINGCLYKRNKIYKQENRELIIANDSIISINIELQNALQSGKTTGR